eukprot:7580071-Alexandrium_andersonii.AAC.1
MSSAMPSTARARSRAEGGAESWTKWSAKSRSSPSSSKGSPLGGEAPPSRAGPALGGGQDGAASQGGGRT